MSWAMLSFSVNLPSGFKAVASMLRNSIARSWMFLLDLGVLGTVKGEPLF